MHRGRPSWTTRPHVAKAGPARPHPKHDRSIEPAFCGPDVGEVGQLLPGRCLTVNACIHLTANGLRAITERAFLVRPIRLKIPIQEVVGNHRPFAIVLGLATASGPRSLYIQPHEAFDPVKLSGKPFVKNIPPHAARAIGRVAGPEARVNRGDELPVMDLAGAGGAVEPGMKTRT